MVSLMLIGHLFMDTHGAQSEKMFTMALLFAQKAHSPHLVCLCADRLLSLLKRQEGVQDRIEQLESVRQEWIGRL